MGIECLSLFLYSALKFSIEPVGRFFVGIFDESNSSYIGASQLIREGRASAPNVDQCALARISYNPRTPIDLQRWQLCRGATVFWESVLTFARRPNMAPCVDEPMKVRFEGGVCSRKPTTVVRGVYFCWEFQLK